MLIMGVETKIRGSRRTEVKLYDKHYVSTEIELKP